MILTWDIYEIQSDGDTLHGVMLRGRIRKYAIEQNITCLSENAGEIEKPNIVRFALLSNTEPNMIIDFIKRVLPNATVSKVAESVQNPTLSKLMVNDLFRY